MAAPVPRFTLLADPRSLSAGAREVEPLKRPRTSLSPHDFVYTPFVKNVTISLPEPIWEALRDRARDNQKSLNGFIGDILARESNGDSAWLVEFESATETHSVETSPWKWNREDTYADRLS